MTRDQLKAEMVRDLINGLKEDLNAEWNAVLRYSYQASKVVGLRGEELRRMFETEIQDEIGHATYLSDVIADMGADPVPVPVMDEQPEDLKGMLELDLEKEEEAAEKYMKHAAIAEELGRVELRFKLEEMAADEDGHAREIRRILRGL